MSHLHIPDGVLPVWLWAPALLVAVSLLVGSTRALLPAMPQRVAYQGALGALVLAAMAIEIPMGPFEYHLTLAGPIGVLLGAAAGFQVEFVASTMLAFVGHGGLTVIGLNALVLGTGVAFARPVYRTLSRARSQAFAMAGATAVAQAVSGVLWLLVMAIGVRSRGWAPDAAGGPARLGLLAAIAFPMWLVGVLVEAAVGFGIARFLARVRPDLLPSVGDADPRAVTRAA